MTIALIITLGIQIVASLALMTAPVLAPEAAGSLNISATKVGVFISLAYVTAMLSSLFSGVFIGRYGSIRVSLLCLILCAIGVGLPVQGSAVAVALGALLIGSGYGPLTPASSHILVQCTPPHHLSLVFSLKQTGVPLGGAFAGILLPPIVVFWDWQAAALTVAVSCFVVALFCQPVRGNYDVGLDRSRKVSLASVFRPFKAVLQTKRVRQLAICTSFFSIMQLCLTTYLVTYLTRDYGVSLTTAGLIMFVVQGAGVVGRVVWGTVADKWMSSALLLALLAFGMALGSGLLALAGPSWPLWILVVISVIYCATAIGWNGVFLAEVARLAPEGQTGLMTGGTLFFTYLGVTVGPPVFTVIVDATSSFSVGYGLLALMITGIALYLMRVVRLD